ARARGRERGDQDLRPRRSRLHAVQPAGRRLADREVPPRRGAPARLADDAASRPLSPLPGRSGLRRARGVRGAGTRARDLSRSARDRLAARRSERDGGGRQAAATGSTPSRARGARPPALALRTGSAGHTLRMSVLVIPEHDVRRLLPMAECIEAMESVLASLARGELHQPLRFVTRPPGADSLMGFMPAHRSGDGSTWSLKEIVIAPGNSARGLDAHQGAVLLHDGETGELQAILNASPITEIRTAAVSAVATRALARPGARTVAIIGAGV